MPRFALLLLVLAFALGGCAGTRTFRPADDGVTRRHLDGRAARVVLTDGRLYDARALRVTPDSVTWTDPSAPRIYGVPVHEVARLDVRSPRLTVGRTALIGTAAAAAVGALLGASIVAEFGVSSRHLVPTMLVGAAFAVPSGAAYGALGGALAPATWTFVPEPPPSSVPPDTSRTARSFAAPRLAP